VADVVDVLLAQHALVEDLFRETLMATGETKQDRFAELVRVLGVHEAAEDAVVHPVARQRIDAPAVVDSRMDEEKLAAQLVVDLVQLGAAAPGVDDAVRELRIAVLTHARHEERYEFPYLRYTVPAEERIAMVDRVRAAERAAAR
jgi:hemerythrin superfamily protein